MRRAALAGAAASLALGAAVRAQETPAAPPAAAQSQPPATPTQPPSQSQPAVPAPAAPAPEAPPEESAPPPPVAQAKPAPPAPPPRPPEPLKRERGDAAIFQATDKITAETLRFQAKVGAPVRYKDLVITVRACDTSAADEAIKDSFAHVEVVSRPAEVRERAAAPRLVYRGWMFANSPGLHPFEHPVYDLWLIACRTVAPSAVGGKR